MTFKEKYELDHSNHPNEYIDTCPIHCGYEDRVPDCHCAINTCGDCWNREMPGTEEKETKETTNMNLSKMKKDELIEQINALNAEIEKLEKYKKYEDGADELKAMFDIYMDRGFSREDVFRLLELSTNIGR